MFIGPGRTPGYGVFSGVEELPPAGCGFWEEGGLRCWRYWSLKDREQTDSFERTVETVRALVVDAIERQLVSDVPVGTFLSGGLDSSLISSVADQHFQRMGQQLQTFSVDYRDNDQYFHASKFQPNRDKPYIEQMNAYLKAKHHDVILETPELVEALFEAVDARDLPGMADVDASLLLFCKEIKQHVTVALSGECADEIFGGYPWYRDPEIRAREGFPWAQSTKYRAGFVQEAFVKDFPAEEYVNARYQATLAATSILPETAPAGAAHAGDDAIEFGLVYGNVIRSQRSDEHVFRPGGTRAILRLPHRGISLRRALGDEGLSGQGKGTPAYGHGGLASGRSASGARRAPIPRRTIRPTCARSASGCGTFWPTRTPRSCRLRARKPWKRF